MACIQPGSSAMRRFAPVKIRSRPKMMLLSTAVSRTRSPIPAQMSPRPVPEKAATKMTSAIAGQAEKGTGLRRIDPEPRNAEAAASGPEHAFGDEDAEGHVDRSEENAHADVGQGRAAGRRLPDCAHAPGRRERPGDRM